MSNLTYIGIDVAKKELCCSLPGCRPFKLSSSLAGINALIQRTADLDQPGNLCFVMESTSGYSEYTADALQDLAGVQAAIVPPGRIIGFKQAGLTRTKNDPTDAIAIRKFAESHQPDPWQPPTPAQRHLRSLQNQMNSLHKAVAQQLCLQEKFLSAYRPDDFALASVARTIRFMKGELAHLQAEFDRTISEDETMAADVAHMLSIPGVGTGVCNVILTVCYRQLRELSQRKLLTFCGMSPKEFQSGQRKGQTRMSKAGDSRVRRVLYMAAMVSVREEGLMRDYFRQQKADGKKGMIAMVNVMRRLLYIIQGVVKSNSPFDINVFHSNA